MHSFCDRLIKVYVVCEIYSNINVNVCLRAIYCYYIIICGLISNTINNIISFFNREEKEDRAAQLSQACQHRKLPTTLEPILNGLLPFSFINQPAALFPTPHHLVCLWLLAQMDSPIIRLATIRSLPPPIAIPLNPGYPILKL